MTSFSKRLLPTPKKELTETTRVMVAIRVIHHRRTGYISTGVDIGCRKCKDGSVVPNWQGEMITPDEPEWLEKNRLVDKFHKEIVDRYAHTMNPGLMSLSEIISHLRMCNSSGEVAMLDVATNDYLESKRGTVSASYMQMVEHSLERFTDWLRGPVALRQICPETIKSYAKYLRAQKKTVEKREPYFSPKYKQVRYTREKKMVPLLSEASIGKELAHIKAVLNHAEAEGQIRYDVHPFSSVMIRRSGAKETDVEPEDIRRLRDAEPDTPAKRLARDVFMLSFYMGGMNYKDILMADFSGDIVVYCREKTKTMGAVRHTVKVPVIPEAREILDRYTRHGRWYSGLKYKNSRDEIGYIGKKLASLVRDLGLPEYMTFYSARKSFAQFSLDLGISDAVTDYLMGHSTGSRGVISYYSRVTPRMAGLALRKVVAYMQDPGKFQEEIERAIMG